MPRHRGLGGECTTSVHFLEGREIESRRQLEKNPAIALRSKREENLEFRNKINQQARRPVFHMVKLRERPLMRVRVHSKIGPTNLTRSQARKDE